MFSNFNVFGAIENGTLTNGACQGMVMRRRPFQVSYGAANTPAFEFMKALFKKGRSRAKDQQTRKALVEHFESKLKKVRYEWSHPSTYVQPKPDTPAWWGEVVELWMRGDLKNRKSVHNPIIFVNAMFAVLEEHARPRVHAPQSQVSKYFTHEEEEWSGFEQDTPPECAITEDEESEPEESEPEHEFLRLLNTKSEKTEWKELYNTYYS